MKALTDDRDIVGAIPFDPKTDKADFHLCSPQRIVPYYSIRTGYQGGTKAIKDFVLVNYKYEERFAEENGYITIRFIINCEGETDRFRILQIDRDYQKKSFPESMTNQLLSATKKLDKWLPGQHNGRSYDSIYYINFKIVNGKITEVLP